MSETKTKVLVVFANPRSSKALRLGSEDRAINEAIKRSKNRENIILKRCHAATIHDLRRAMLEDQYQIVHISGHGTGNGLVLEDEGGGMFVVPQHALAEYFQSYSKPEGSLECVILNACYSISQGKIISLGVPLTIAVEGPINDNAAIEFSRGFYDAIGAGYAISFAYAEGCRTVELAASGAKWNSKLLKKDEVYVSDTTDKIELARSDKEIRFRDVKALVGLAVDLSGSMAQNIRNNSGGKLSRLEGFRQSLDKFVKDARNTVRRNKTKNIKSSIDLFAFGFGLRSDEIRVCDLLSLMRIGKEVITRDEIEELKQSYTQEIKNRYRGYSGLGDLVRQWGLGAIVEEAEHVIRSNAEGQVRHRIMLEVKNRLETQLETVEDTTLPIEEVAELWDNSEETLSNADELIFGNTPMQEALVNVKERFDKELATRSGETISVLFLLSDGEPTDGDPLPVIQELKSLGVIIISCFVTDQDIADPRVLFGKPEPKWNDGAKLMFDIASNVEDDSNFVSFLLNKGWKINPNANLFVQINHSDILEEFIQVILSPLEERDLQGTLPRGI